MSVQTETLPVSSSQLLELYRSMRTIRAFEDQVHEDYSTREVPGAVHLYAGQEAVAAGVIAHLRDDDYISSTHRGHGHAVAKGCDLTSMMLEIYGREGGLCGGKGGSMHIADFDRGMLGANGVAAGGVPLAAGAALSAKARGTDQVAVAFVGDGGVNQGAFAETLSLASVWELPIIFVVEDNGYAQATGSPYHLRGIPVAERARGYGIPAKLVDGYDAIEVHEAAGEMIARAREGEGPSMLECQAVRFYGHMEGWDGQGYRAPDEADRLRETSDCLKLLAERAISAGIATEDELARIDEEAVAAASAASEVARVAPQPDEGEVSTDVYVSP